MCPTRGYHSYCAFSLTLLFGHSSGSFVAYSRTKMYDYDSKEEASSSPPTSPRKSMTTTIDFVYSPTTPRSSEIDMNKHEQHLRLTTTTSTISEDMKSNDANYHGCESPAAFRSSSSSSLFSSQAEESIDTPIISNRPMQREAPPLLCLPPTLSSHESFM